MLKEIGLAIVATVALSAPSMAQNTSPFDMSAFGPSAPPPSFFPTSDANGTMNSFPGMPGFRGNAINSQASPGDAGFLHDSMPTSDQAIQLNQPARMTTENQSISRPGMGGQVAPLRTGTMGLAPVFGYGGGSRGLQSPGGYDPFIRLPFGLGQFRPPTNIGLPGGGNIGLPPINSNTFPF